MAKSSAVDGVPAELVAQRGHRLHRRRVVLAGREAGEQRRGDHVHRHGEADRLLDRPPALAGVVGVALELSQVRILSSAAVEQFEQPRLDDGALAPDLTTAGTSDDSDAFSSSYPSAYACIMPYSMPLWTILA